MPLEACQPSALPSLADETPTLGLCGMVWEHSDSTDYHKQPWQAKISVTVSMASGGGAHGRRGQGEVRVGKGKSVFDCGVWKLSFPSAVVPSAL